MNIKEAKTQIMQSVAAYLTKDSDGNYVIPMQKQRPVFLMGPPGIGKTAVMEQVAQELGIGFISYSMTHHTRQSALGLPFIAHKKYGDMEYEVSEYTMSEIISSVYSMMESTGVKEGILFLDEINCVSETLAPVMLQFLQYKVFGCHQVPEGWIVVTAGNPPEYNKSVREFDIATWDRLKRIDISPDYAVWKEYSVNTGVHPAVLTYLDSKTSDFYSIVSTVDGKEFVTARGWDDLSAMIYLYEQHSFPVDSKLIGQYVQSSKITRSFYAFYDLLKKYQSDYQISSILQGKAEDSLVQRAKSARFDERLALLGLILAELRQTTDKIMTQASVLAMAQKDLTELKKRAARSRNTPASDILEKLIQSQEEREKSARKAGSMSKEKLKELAKEISLLEEIYREILGEASADEALKKARKMLSQQKKELNAAVKKTQLQFSNVFTFCEEAFSDGQELIILVTELTVSQSCVFFISNFGCPEYFRHSKELMFYERSKEIIEKLEKLGDLEDLDELEETDQTN